MSETTEDATETTTAADGTGRDETARVMRTFAERLQEFERTRDVGPLAELFADDAELSKLDNAQVHHGRDGARAFWTEYRDVFGDLASTFVGEIVGDGRAVLEWVADGTLSTGSGRAIHYPGVSVLDVAGGSVTRFRTYYDSGPFLVGGDEVVGG